MLPANPDIPRNVLRRALKAPVLIHVFRQAEAITVRSFAEWEASPGDIPATSWGEEAEVSVELASHLPAISGVRHYGNDARSRGGLGERGARTFRREWVTGGGGKPLRLVSAATLDRRWPLGSGEWTDFATWVWPIRLDGRMAAPFNRELLTRDSRSQKWRLFSGREVSAAFQVFVPFAAWDFAACQTYILAHPRLGFAANFAIDRDLGETEEPNIFHFQAPRISVGGPATIPAGGTLDLPVELRWSDGAQVLDVETVLFAEAVSGYLPKPRVAMAGGEGNLRVMALGLDPGDRIRVKLGFRNWRGASDKILAVV